jgi:hypothetical protein
MKTNNQNLVRSGLATLTLCIVITVALNAQHEEKTMNATLIKKAEFRGAVPSLATQLADGTFQYAEDIDREVNPKRRGANVAVPGKGLPKGMDPLWDQTKSSTGIKSPGPILTFEAASANATPTDPTGAVGPDHYVNSWNSSFRIWDKEGNALTPAASLGTIFPGETLGDPIVFYDQVADRFLITEFTALNGFLVAISQDSDPVTSGWYTYYFSTNTFPDYPKYSLWSDGYYITANKDTYSAGSSEVVFVLERDKMLDGDPDVQMIGFPLPGITTSGFYSPLGFSVNGTEMPPPGNVPIVYLQDDVWSGVSSDHLKIWTIDVDWETAANSTISDAQEIETTPFDGLFDGGSFSNIPQPSGPDIDAIQATIMYMAHYRRFSEYNAVVFNFVVDLDGSDDYAGIRWYELRQEADGDPWEIYQEGTYVQPDGHSAIVGTMAMDVDGNIALAYTAVSETLYPSIRYTGRYSTDPPGEMTIEEEVIADGTTNDPSFRYGDYSHMTLDPVDEKTFWTIAEYFTGSTRKNQVGVFKLAPDLANDVGIVSIDAPTNGILTAAEPITVTIRNFGIDTQESIPVSFQIDGGAVITETYIGSLPSNSNDSYTFTAAGDFSTAGEVYEIMASTEMETDENEGNNGITSWVKHLHADDLGVMTVLEPLSGSQLGIEPITVTIMNFGANSQADFDLTYLLDDNDPVVEQVPGPLASEATMEYTFTTTGDFSVVTDHTLVVASSHPDDGDTTNDTTMAVVSNTLCQPLLLCEYGVGIYSLELAEVNNVTGCDTNGYGNYMALKATMEPGSSNDLTISTEHGSVFVKAWIDFNDNFMLESDEIVVDDYEIAPGQTQGNYTETMSLLVPADVPIGEHLMRVKTNYNEEVPDDPCEETLFGETEDYTALVDDGTDISTPSLAGHDLVVANTGGNRFLVKLESAGEEPLALTVHNLQGQMMVRNMVRPINGTYTFDLDMSYAPRGVYLLRLGSEGFGKIKRFVVE